MSSISIAIKQKSDETSGISQQKTPLVMPLRLEQICFDAGQQRLIDSISLEFAPGSRTVILGSNGAGKSLLLRLCHGLLKPSSGRIQWAITAPEIIARAQAMVFQRPVMLRRSVLANMYFALAAHGIARRQRKKIGLAALAEVGLDSLARRPARVLSGGEQQRLALARAWALHPQVLFLDEPTANLDPGATRLIEDIISRIHRSGTTIIMTTHDIGQAKRHADRVVFLHHGRLLELQAAADFFTQPKTRPAQAFLAGDLPD